MSRLIYLDNAATTQVYPEVVDAMLPYFTEHYGNPSAIYSFADEAERAVDHARGEVADLIGAKKDEIYFTGGGSESDNWALKATAEAYKSKGNHIITSKIEHHAMLHACEALERGKRGGTENMAYIVGLATAVENAYANLPKMQAVAALRDSLRDRILAAIPHSTLNGPCDGAYRLPGNLNIGFEYIEGESMLLLLDAAGICASTGSACSSASLDPSHVLLATGVPHERAHGSLRLSISSETSEADADYILEVLPPIIKRLRDMSPLYEEALKAHKV